MTKNSNIKKVLSITLVIITILSTFAISASAASKVNAFNVPTSSKYAKVYTISKTGKTIPYTSKYLSTRGTTKGASNSAYIDNSSDELYLIDVGVTNGKTWAYVSYPVSSGRRYAYIYLSSISSASYGTNHLYYASASGKFYCSPRKGGTTSSSYYVDKGDKVYVFSASSSSGTYCQIMYPVSGNKWRIAWCTYNDARKYLDNVSSSTSSKSYTGYVNTSSSPLVLRKSASTSSSALANMPKGSSLTVLDNKTKTNGFYHVTYNGKTGYASASYIIFSKPSTSTSLVWPASAKYVTCLYYYASGSKHSTRYGYNNAIDIAGGGNIYAAASGTVETVAYQSGGFGNYIVIKHNDGTRTLYAHLKSYSVKQGQYVSQGQTIGVMGSTGNSSGVHLHFEWSGGDPWKTYFKSNNSLKYEYNVRANNSKYNSDKTIVNWIDSNYKYSNGWYVHR